MLTRVQSKACTEPSSSSSLFNLPYSKDIHYFSQVRHIAHPTTQCRKFFLYTISLIFAICQLAVIAYFYRCMLKRTTSTGSCSVEDTIAQLYPLRRDPGKNV